MQDNVIRPRRILQCNTTTHGRCLGCNNPYHKQMYELVIGKYKANSVGGSMTLPLCESCLRILNNDITQKLPVLEEINDEEQAPV